MIGKERLTGIAMGFISQYKGLRRDTYILAFGRFVTCLGSMIWPMMTLILTQKMGLDAERTSWILAAAGIAMLPAVVIGGKLADSCNKRNNIIIMDAISVTCYVTCAVIPLSWTSVILMFAGSIFQNMENPSYNALTADLSRTEERERSYSLQYLGSNLGLVAAPTLAGFLIQNHLPLVFLINGSSIACSAVLIFTGIKDVTPVVETGKDTAYQEERKGVSIMRILRDSPVLLVFIAVYCGYFAVYEMYVYLMPLDMVALHGSSGYVIYGTFTSVNCIVVVVFTPVITKLCTSVRDAAKAALGVTLLEAGFGLFMIMRGFIPAYYISMAVLTMGEIFAMLAESPYLTRRVPSSHRGRINGAATMLRTGATSIFQVIIGHIYAAAGDSAAWNTVILTGAGAIALALMMMALDRKEFSELYEK